MQIRQNQKKIIAVAPTRAASGKGKVVYMVAVR